MLSKDRPYKEQDLLLNCRRKGLKLRPKKVTFFAMANGAGLGTKKRRVNGRSRKKKKFGRKEE